MSRILIVDDEKPIRRIVSVLLTEQGHEVAETESGEEALERQVNFQRELGLAVKAIAPEARRLLLDYDWPGNVRELENTICRTMILCDGDVLTVSDLPPRVRGELPEGTVSSPSDLNKLKLADAVNEATERLEKMMIVARLAEYRGNRTGTAESLGISRKTLFNKMRQYGLSVSEEEE